MKKLKRLICAFLAFVLVGVNTLNSVVPVMAAEDPTVRNEAARELADGVVLSKTAESVPGYANMWKVTLGIEAPVVKVTSDTVLVIDKSFSMIGTPLAEAKTAAKSLANKLLPEGNVTNRVAVVSFSSNNNTSVDIGFSDNYDDVAEAIDGITQSSGTFTQKGLHEAVTLISSSAATYKTIILLSDGQPSYSYAFTSDALNDGDNFVSYQGNAVESSKEVEQSVFGTYNSVAGSGNGMRTCADNSRPCTKYYNHGNSAIAEAQYYKDSNIGDLYTIAFNVREGDAGEEVLKEMASSADKYHTATEGELEGIFNTIAGNIHALVNSTHVHDVMGEGVVVENPEHSSSLDWDPVFAYDEEKGKYVAYYTYEVEADEHILDENSPDGFHPLNKEATITYNGKTEKFPVPYVKPFFVNVKKNVEGQTCAEGECVFTFRIEHPSGAKTTEYTVEAGKTHRIVEAFPIGDYTLTEIGTNVGNPVKFENYLVSYTGNLFTINEQHTDHIDVTMTNTYETIDLTASKVWQDGDDRDGLRSNYNNLYVVVKNGDNYVAHEKVTGATSQNFEFDDLPKNQNDSVIQYTIGEAICTGSETTLSCRDFSDSEYISTVGEGNVITNTHTPATTKLTIKKKWDTSAGTLPSVAPGFVTVEVSNDKNDTVETVTLRGDSYTEWTGEFEGYKYEEGEEIHYSVREKDIAGSLLSNNTLYIYKDDVLEGKWVATQSGAEITNTWSPAQTVYTGAGEFYIEKTDQDNEFLPGVVFTVNGETYITGSDGRAKVEFSGSSDEPEVSYTFNITETSAPDYYDVIEGTEILKATTVLSLTVSEDDLTNTYTKSFVYEVLDAADGYVWQQRDGGWTLLVTDQALADELVIEKTFEGISETAFEENSEISFTISGPNGFTEMTVGINDDECEMSDGKLVCTIDGGDVLMPVGQYTVTENNAGITNFTYTSEPANGKVIKTVKLGDSTKFTFKNVYTSVNTASFKVRKVWEDDNDRDGVRPDDLEVALYADGEAYGEPVKLTAGENWSHEWTELPLVNEDAEEIEYTVVEEDLGGDYEPDDGEMKDGVFVLTNTREPEKYNETGDLTVQKIWAGEGNELARPGSVMVELLANGEVIDQAEIVAGQNNEWAFTFTDLYKNDGGEPIEYSVQESGLGEMAFGENESTLVIYADDDTIAGSWTKSVSGFEVTNTWTEATDEIIYEGADEFTIRKVDENHKPLSEVAFAVEGHSDKITNEDGEIVITVPISEDEKEENFTYIISEKGAKDGYDPADGSATVTINCTSELSGTDADELVNAYIKTCVFSEEGDRAFNWNEGDLVLTVVNNRSMAKSLTIEKIVEGLSSEVLTDLEFIIEGPDDFGEDGEMTLEVSNDCDISDGIIICQVSGKIPTGEYKVTEENAEIEYFELTVSGDYDTKKTVKKDDAVVFEIKNHYEVEQISYGVVKIWDDAHDKEGKRPEELTIELLANGEVIETINMTADDVVIIVEEDEEYSTGDVWVYIWEELPYADEYAEVIIYTAEEKLESSDYELTETESDEYYTLFVNSHELDDPCAEGGCGGDIIPPVAPETGWLTVDTDLSGGQGAAADNTIVLMVVMIISTVTLYGAAKFAKRG